MFDNRDEKMETPATLELAELENRMVSQFHSAKHKIRKTFELCPQCKCQTWPCHAPC